MVYRKTLSLVDIAPEYDVGGNSLKTYTYKKDKGISYVNIEQFIKFVRGGIINLEVEKEDTLNLSYTISVPEEYIDIIGSEKYTYEMTFNANTDTIYFNDFDLLANLNVEPKTEYISDIKLVDFEVPKQNNAHEINLHDYGLDIVLERNSYYIPLYLANLFFTGSYMNVYEMDDKIYLIDNSSDLSELTDDFKSESSVPEKNLKAHTTKYLALYFDHFYGLKDYHGVDSYSDELEQYNIDKQDTADEFYGKIDEFLMRRDDLHTSLITAGYRNKDYVKSFQYLKDEKMISFLNSYTNNACYNRRHEISYDIYGTTMIITINAFSESTKDSITSIMKSAKKYEDIIFDLSCNTGGAVGAVLEVLVYLTDQPIPVSYLNPVTGTTQTEYYQSSTNKYLAKNYYLYTSKVTYSAANLFASIFRDMKLGKILGESSNGGAAAITYTVLPDGAIITNSSNLVFINRNSEVIEEGIDVDIESNHFDGWWNKVNQFKNVLRAHSSINFTYDNLSDIFHFNLSIEGNLEEFDFEGFTLTINDFYTGKLVKEYVFNDFTFEDSIEKTQNSEIFVVKLRAKYKYKDTYSNELISFGEIDKDLGIVGDYHYREINVGESFPINILNYNDIDVVKVNITKKDVYTINKSLGFSGSILIYDEAFNVLGSFQELLLSEGIYYIAIDGSPGNHEFTINNLIDDNEGNTVINLVNGENQTSVLLDYYPDDETLEFTLSEDKIITLSSGNHFKYQIFDADGNKIDPNVNEYYGYYDSTFRFPKGTYYIKIYQGKGLININVIVIDDVSDYTDDFSKVDEFGKLVFDENLIILDDENDSDIYYVDIIEKGHYVFTGENIKISKIDENGNKYYLPMKQVIELEEGRHFFIFSHYNYSNMKIVKVQFTQVIDESDENNHLAINIGEEIKTIISNQLDKDYFDFTINESGVYKIDFQSENVDASYNIYQGSALLLGFQRHSNEIFLYKGNYTIMLYQTDVTKLRNAVFTISKR